MENRKRYYNSFLDQIQEYKQDKKGEDLRRLFDKDHQVLGAGLFAALLSLFVFGGYLDRILPDRSVSGISQYFPVGERLKAGVFRVDRSLADVAQVKVPGVEVLPLGDAVVDAVRTGSLDGRRRYLELSRTRAVFLKFDMEDMEDFRSGVALKLYLWVKEGDGSLLRLGWSEDVNWSENLLTYGSVPEVVGLDIVPKYDGETGAYVFDITKHVAGARAFTLRVSAESNIVVYARESGVLSPRISVGD